MKGDSPILVATGLRAGGEYENKSVSFARQGRRALLILFSAGIGLLQNF
jgi:hypothetical protein